MPLQVWLPLNGNLTNNGLKEYNLSMFRGTETYNASGKIGKCFYSNGVNTIKILNIIPDFYNYSAYSISAWFYIESQNTSHTGSAIVSAGNWNQQLLNLAVSNWSTDHYTQLRVSGANWNATYNCTFNLNTWYHAVVSSEGSKTRAYVNGTLIGDTLSGTLPTSIDGNDIAIGGATYASSMQFFGRINDVRIFDHALSLKEVKLLSQGLVCHYPLNNAQVTDNMILNGNGIDGGAGWNYGTSGYISTTEIPPDQTTIKASYFGHNATNTYTPISHDTTYTISAYLKAYNSSGNCYPSLVAYDADKREIRCFNSPDGFNSAYITTLAQPLHKGDTVIYATNLSAWTTASNNYYYHVAIFGYTDNHGNTYPDMGYTADSPVFGTYADKSNIDKTNNTITLTSAFTGEDRPAGTTICQATEGGTYYYPFGGINLTTIPDWTLKTATVNPTTVKRLQYATYVNYLAYGGAYHAGITLVDNNKIDVIYDSSGYNYYCTVATSGLLPSVNTPRNLVSTYFDGTAQITRETITSEVQSVCFWLNTPKTATTIAFADHSSKIAFGFNSGKNIITGCAGRSVYMHPSTAITADTWHHIAIVKTASTDTDLLYIDGVLQTPISYKDNWTHQTTILSITGRSMSNPNKMTCYMSDFRMYATALSADDILALYNNPASVTNTGAFTAQGEFVEL